MELISEKDDDFHHLSNDIWETETCWFSFNVPQRTMGCWLYAWIRPNLRNCAGGVFLWDDTGVNPWELPYYWYQHSQPLPPIRDLRHFQFPENYSVKQLQPLKRYQLQYRDRKYLSIDVEWTALCEPHPFLQGVPPFRKSSHFDQPGHIVGEMVLDGEIISIDSYSMRDRSWGPRPDHKSVRVGYPFGVCATTAFCCFVQTDQPAVDGADLINHGFLWRDGLRSQLVSGRRKVERDPRHNWITRMQLEAKDELGRMLKADGIARSRAMVTNSRGVCCYSQIFWDIDGTEAYGEDQDVWRIDQWRDALCALRTHARKAHER